MQGWQKGFMRRAVLQQLKFESAAYSQIIFLRQHPIPMLPLLCLFFYSFPSSALFLSSFFFFFTTRSLRKNALSISEHSSFSTPRSTFT